MDGGLEATGFLSMNSLLHTLQEACGDEEKECR